jgi:hypothetical protein
MKKLSTIMLASALVLTSCSARQEGEVATTAEPGVQGEEAPTEQAAPPEAGQVRIVANPGFEVSGEANVQDLEGGKTRVDIGIHGAPSDAILPWHVHEGTCGSGGAIVGDPNAYQPLNTDLSGEASADATIGVGLDPGTDYHINVHESPSNTETIVACGELKVS